MYYSYYCYYSYYTLEPIHSNMITSNINIVIKTMT
jgi:hypothetical protein